MRPDNQTHPMFEPVRKALMDGMLELSLDDRAERIVEALRDHFALYAEHEEPATITDEPGDTETEQFSHVAMEAVKNLLLTRPKGSTVLHATLVVTAPEAKIAIASTEQQPVWMLEALHDGYMSARRLVRNMGVDVDG